MSSLSNGVDTITPDLILGFESSNDSGTVVHRKLDGTVDVSIAADSPRDGDLRLFFAAEADAKAARELLIQPTVWTLTAEIDTADGMTFVRQGTMSAVQQDARLRWVLTVGYQEIVS